MSAAGHPEPARDRVAATLRDAEFVRLVATADGDALAAAGLLASGLDAAEVPYQVSLAAVPDPPATDAGCTVAVGTDGGDVTVSESPLAVAAAEIVRSLAAEAVDATLALAGAYCAGYEPEGWLLEQAGLERAPGIAIPTDDSIEGLAGSTLLHAGFSGDGEAAAAAVAALETADGRSLASLAALSAVEDAPPRAANAVQRFLHPHSVDRFETLGGFADVLDAVARERPGSGIALALGHDIEETALEAWRSHGQRAHEAVRSASSSRYDGVSVVRVDGAAPDTLGTVARLWFQYRSPEPTVVAVTDGAAAVTAEGAVESPLREATTALGGRSTARNGHGTATFDASATDFTAAIREAL